MLQESLNISLTNVKLLHIKTELVDFYILHVGRISSFLKLYFLNNNIEDTTSKEIQIENLAIDIALINKDGDPKYCSLKGLSSVKVIVQYTKVTYVKSGTDYIHLSLIPILIRYLLKIKESSNLINYKNVGDYSSLFLKKVYTVIDEHIDDDSLTMKKLGNLMFMSRSSLSKKIKQYSGLKPTEFINQYKLEKSKHLLTVTNWQISKIADVLGFCSQQYYSRLFKIQEGVNPSKYRLEYQNT